MKNFELFLNTIRKEIKLKDSFSDEKIKIIIDRIVEHLKNNNNLDYFSYKKDRNITSNSIYFFSFEDKSKENFIYELVLKIRREASPLEYDDELKYLNILNEKELIPKQLLNFNIDFLRISIEEFINSQHVNNYDAFNENILKILIENLSELNSIEISQLEKNEDKFYFKFLIEKVFPYSIDKFTKILEYFDNNKNDNCILFEYFEENKNNLKKIKLFLDEIPKYYKTLIQEEFKTNLVFSHVDVHNTNIFIIREKLKFIDFEDLSFNFPGFDLINFIIESIYEFNEDSYPFFDNEINKIDDEFLITNMNSYMDNLNRKTKTEFKELTIKDINKLICLSLIKSVIEYIFMINEEEIYKKIELDFILLIVEKIKIFEERREYYK